MSLLSSAARWMPFALLVLAAILFEPLRSGFVLENQTCELVTNWQRVKGGILNFRHIVGYGIICFVAILTIQHNSIIKAAAFTFVFSVFLEYQQSFFSTGHCRSWDLVPNIIAIAIASLIFLIIMKLIKSQQS